MPTFKWFALISALGFAFCGAISLFMPAPPNPVKPSELSIGARLAVPANTRALLKRACYDCHSNETRWPAYSRIWPASAMIYSDVSKGRATMNFSEWPSSNDPHQARRAAGLLMASCAAMQSGLMPRKQYLMMHPDAKVLPDEAKQYCAWTSTEVVALRKLSRVPVPNTPRQ